MKCDEKITLKGGRQCSTYRFVILHKSIKLAQIAFIMHVVVVLATISKLRHGTDIWRTSRLTCQPPLPRSSKASASFSLLSHCIVYVLLQPHRPPLLSSSSRQRDDSSSFDFVFFGLHFQACCKQGFWVALGPCVHKSLQFVSLCEYDFVRNGFGVYHRFANQLWSFQ